MLDFCLDLSPCSYTYALPHNEIQNKLPFSSCNCGHFYAREQYYTKRDGLSSYLLIITEDGCGEMRTNDGYCLLKKGSAVVIDCNLYQEYSTQAGNSWNFYFVHFNTNLIEAYYEPLLKQLTPVPLRNLEYAKMLMKKMYHLSCIPTALNYIEQSNILSELLTEMVRSLTEFSEPKIHRQDINSLIEYIQNNFQNDLHLSDFIKEINLSQYYLIRLFKQKVGMPPYQYLHFCRINHAKFLLKTTTLSITQIAHEVGYNDLVVFIRRFKAQMKLTPLAYRQAPIAF